MKKKITILSIVSLLASPLFACQIVLENNSGTSVSVTDLVAQTPAVFVQDGSSVNANKDPNTHAQLQISIGPKKILVKQIACSESRIIPIKSADLAGGILDKAFFEME